MIRNRNILTTILLVKPPRMRIRILSILYIKGTENNPIIRRIFLLCQRDCFYIPISPINLAISKRTRIKTYIRIYLVSYNRSWNIIYIISIISTSKSIFSIRK